LLRSEFDLIQTGFNLTEVAMLLRAPIASPAFTGTPTAPTASPGTSSAQLATTEFVAAQAFSSALPGQAGNAGKVLSTDGNSAGWASSGLTRVLVGPITQAATAGNDYWLANVAATTVTAPTATDGAKFRVTPVNGLINNIIDFGASTVLGYSGATASGLITMTLGAPMEFEYSTTLGKWVMA